MQAGRDLKSRNSNRGRGRSSRHRIDIEPFVSLGLVGRKARRGFGPDGASLRGTIVGQHSLCTISDSSASTCGNHESIAGPRTLLSRSNYGYPLSQRKWHQLT